MTGFVRFPWIRTLIVGWLALGTVTHGHAQQSGSGSATQKQTPANTSPKDTGTPPAQTATQPLTPAERKRAELLADTEKLYQLTQELKAEVAKSNKDTLSVSVVKKAQEVERLAKSIKERSRAQ
jgi:type VI protein secretion system component VasF